MTKCIIEKIIKNQLNKILKSNSSYIDDKLPKMTALISTIRGCLDLLENINTRLLDKKLTDEEIDETISEITDLVKKFRS